MPPRKRGRVAKSKATQDAGAEPVVDDESEPVDAGLPLDSETKLSSETFPQQASDVLDEPAVLQSVVSRLRGKQPRSTKKAAGKQANVGEAKDTQVESESTALSEVFNDLPVPAVPESAQSKAKGKSRKKAVKNETGSSKYESKEESLDVNLIMPLEPVPLKSKGKSKSKAAKKNNSTSEQEDLETEWAVSSCSDDSRKNVMLIRRRRSDLEQQQSEDGTAGNAVSDVCSPIAATFSPVILPQQQSEITDVSSCKEALDSQQSVESGTDSIGSIPQQPDKVLELATSSEKSRRRSLRNRSSDVAPTDQGPIVAPRVTRSGKKIASRVSLQAESGLASTESKLELAAIEPLVSLTTTDSAVDELSQESKLTPLSYERTSLLVESTQTAIADVVLSPTKNINENVASNLVEEAAPVSASEEGTRSLSQQPGTPIQGQISAKCATPEIVSGEVEESDLESDLKDPAEQACDYSNDLPNSNLDNENELQSTVASVSTSSLPTNLDQVSPVSAVTESIDKDSDKETNVAEEETVLNISHCDGSLKVQDPVPLVSGTCSSSGSSSKAELENVSSVHVGCAELGGSVRILSGTDSEPSSDEIPLKKRRIRAAFSSTECCTETYSEPDIVCVPSVANISGEVLTERQVNIPDDVDVRQSAVLLPALSARRQNKFVGGHVSLSGNVCNALRAAHKVGSRALGMFIKRQSSLLPDPLSNSEILEFKSLLKSYGIAPHLVVPHASYLLNCGSGDESELENSRQSLVDDLKRCQSLGLSLFNFHPGTCKGNNADDCIDLIAASINFAHSRVSDVTIVLENMCGQANTIGGTFLELRRIINRITDKARIGVCLDTCHAFAAGYELDTELGRRKMMDEFSNIIGLNYLKAIHINDSKDDVGSHQDHHAAIGQGKIGLECFKWIMNEPLFDNIPIILETPGASHKAEIELLYQLCD